MRIRLLTILLMVLLVAPAWAQELGDDAGWNFNENTGELRIWKNFSGSQEYDYPWNDLRGYVESLVIEDQVTNIGKYAFSDFEAIVSVVIPNGVTVIDERAFNGCSSLTSIVIPNSVTNIGKSAFRDCIELASVDIPNSVTTIGDYAFYGCSSMKSVAMGSGVTEVGTNAFGGCNALLKVDYKGSVKDWVKIKFTIAGSNPVSKAQHLYIDDKEVTSLVIPDGVTSIENNAFNQYAGLTSVVIPNSVTSIGNSVFNKCTNLTSVTIPGSVKSIGDNTFNECSNLTFIELPEGVTNIGKNAFAKCAGLTSVVIPKSLTSIGNGAFSGCNSLAQVVTDNENVSMLKTYLGASVTYFVPCSFTDEQLAKYKSAGLVTSQHTKVIDEALEATCTESGLTEGSHCSVCSKVLVERTLVPAKGHNWGDWTTTKAATCVEKGSKQRVCSHDASHVDVAEIDIDHDNHVNVVTDNAVPSTCTESGLTEGSHCSVCSKVLVERTLVPTKGHNWGDWTTTKAATCVEKGSKQRVCSHDVSHVDVAEIDIDHDNHANVVTDKAVPATCTESGLTEGSHCSACHIIIVAQEEVIAHGHIFTNYVYNEDATYETDGTETAECDYGCGAKDTHTAEDTKLLPTGVGHVLGNGQKIVKTIENGRVVIVRDGKKYDLSGREVK
ncbi:MAG: leucine-rich repeat domain-containing protein [Bacteroidales bacterium]|nr:leucine-rich repeat domain-containing protein [Bacteroidales bacterium]